MTFLSWIEYPSAMICVNKNDTSFVCVKYTPSGRKIMDSEKRCSSIEELENFLFSIPNPPTKFIQEFIVKLKVE